MANGPNDRIADAGELDQIVHEDLKEFPESQRDLWSQRVVRLDVAKEALRAMADEIYAGVPPWWQLTVAKFMDDAGNAMLTFFGRVKFWAKIEIKAGKYLGWGSTVMQKTADLLGLKVGKSFLKPSPDKIAKFVIKEGFNVSEYLRLSKKIENARADAQRSLELFGKLSQPGAYADPKREKRRHRRVQSRNG